MQKKISIASIKTFFKSNNPLSNESFQKYHRVFYLIYVFMSC